MTVLKYIFIILEVLLLFNLLIFVHELGHFLAAKWRGLKIERFAIWFGKPIWKTRIKGVEYRLPTRVWNSHHVRLPANILTGCVCRLYFDFSHRRLFEFGRSRLFKSYLR